MYCVNCELEIKNKGQDKCPICGWALIEYSEIEKISDESKVDSEPERLSETVAQGVKESTFFDLESALNTDDEEKEAQKPEVSAPAYSASEPESEPELVPEEGSTNDMLASVLDKFDPIEEPVTPASDEPEPGPKRPSKVLPAIAVIGVLITAAAIVSIVFFKSQLESYLPISQLKTDTENKAGVSLNIIMKKEKEDNITRKEPETVDIVQTAEKETSQENSDSVKETTLVTEKKDLQPSGIKTPERATVKKKKHPDKSVEKKASPTNSYSIHTGSYITMNVAEKESKRLKQLGFDAYVQTTDLQKGQIWHRVKVGKFNTRIDAKKVQNDLRQKCPEIKAYIMVRKAKSQKPLTNEAERKSIAIEKPTLGDLQPVQMETPQPEAAPAETASSDEILPDTQKDSAPLVSQPGQTEIPQPETAPVETASSDEILPDTQKDTSPLIPQPGQTEIPQPDLDSVETIPVVTPEKADQPSVINVLPGNTVKGKAAVEPGGKITSQKVVYSINTNSYKIKKIAVNETIRFKFLGFDDAYIQTDDLGKGEIWYRVMIGEFSSLEDAQKVQNDLRQRDPELKSIIMKLENHPTQ